MFQLGKAQNGQERIIALPLSYNHIKGTSFLESWYDLLHRVTPRLGLGNLLYICTLDCLFSIKLERVGLSPLLIHYKSYRNKKM